MSASGSDINWVSLLDDEKQKIENRIGVKHIRDRITDSSTFRDHLESFCRKQGESRVSQIEAGLLPSFNPIMAIAKAVDKSAPGVKGRAAKDSLLAMVHQLSFSLVELGVKTGFRLRPLAALSANLNRCVPFFEADKGAQFWNAKEVQKPLQEVISSFVALHLFVRSHLAAIENRKLSQVLPHFISHKQIARGVDPTQDDVISTRFSQTKQLLEVSRGTFSRMVSQVEEDLARKHADAQQPSLDAQRSMPHPDHPEATREIHARFVFQRRLGRGTFGEVDEVRELTTGESYARKHFHLSGTGYSSAATIADEVKKEVSIMQKLRHSHITTVLFYLKDAQSYSIFMLPVADYDLLHFLNQCSEKKFETEMTNRLYPWFGCLLDALAYAHKLKIKHRDIKPSNILIKNHQPFLSDFGLAEAFEDSDQSASDGKPHGALWYRAPEVIAGTKRGRKSDVFSLGCVYTEMLSVLHCKSLREYRDGRKNTGSIVFRECLPFVKIWVLSLAKGNQSMLNDYLAKQILRMIDEEEEQRFTAEEAMVALKWDRAFFCVE